MNKKGKLKTLLSLLGGVALVGGITTTVVACSPTENKSLKELTVRF